MVKLKLLSDFSEYDKEEVDRALNSISEVCNNLEQLEKDTKISRFTDSMRSNSIEIKRNWDLLKQVSNELDYIFDF